MLEGKYKKTKEKEIQEFWEKQKIYEFNLENKKEIYSVDTPPPTISGALHIGHIFAYTQAEIVVRYKRTRGFNVYYPFGFDNNGLPTERLVEKETKKQAKDYPRSEFLKLCRQTSDKYVQEYYDIWKSMGFSTDWNLKYETNDEVSRRISQRSFIELVKMNKAYQKDSPVLWCVHCKTSIAQAELDNKDVDSKYIHIPFYVGDEKIVVATTRPEYLGGCVALVLNPLDKRVKKLKGKKAIVPLYNHEVPIILDEKADLEKGTGAVMCCTYGDMVDVEWQEKHKLKYIKVINHEGIVSKDIKYIGGNHIIKAKKVIEQLLDEKGLIIKKEPIIHNVGTHERCGEEIEILPSKQWYIDVLSERKKFIDTAKKLNWKPDFMKHRYINWVENLKWDWCISRQRYYGVPFPVWYCSNCRKPHFPKDSELPVNPLEQDYKNTCSCGNTKFFPEKDVMDTWATSSLTPLINAKWKEKDEKKYLMPATLRPQGHDIIRTWAFYTIVKNLYHEDEIPWKDLMINGFVLAKKGEKFSKSKSNAKNTPENLITNYGADSIRYWAAVNKLGSDSWFSEEDIRKSSRFLTKLWNVSKFILMHLQEYDGKKPNKIHKSDLWILNKMNLAKEKYIDFMDDYEVGGARKEIDYFFWHDLCDNYIELAKERLYQPKKHGDDENKSAKYTIEKILLEVLKMYAPITPHICESIYQSYFKDKQANISITTSNLIKEKYDISIVEKGNILKNLISSTRKYKSEKGLSMKEKIKEINIFASLDDIAFLKEIKKDIEACLGFKKINYVESDEFNINIKED